jgi:S-DNA-T family DNA segregation ATPase FtsK/SpoIIIE
MGTRLELRLGDPMDSVIDIRQAKTVPQNAPGRGLTAQSKLHFLAALPRIDGRDDTDDLGEGVSSLVAAVAESWGRRPAAPPVRMLPAELPAATLPAPEGNRMALGLFEADLEPAWHDFSESPHLLVIGDSESGKTNLLRLIARSVAARYTPEEARILLVDYRRTLAGTVPEEHLLGQAMSSDALKDLLSGVAPAIAQRVPGTDISPSRMRLADWWQGPRLFVLVDDYEMVGNSFNNPFEPLLEHLTLGYEMGIHLVVARAATGAARSAADPLVRRLMEVNSSGLLLSCPPAEGQLLGNVKPRLLPPGRALRVVRRKTTVIQTAMVD